MVRYFYDYKMSVWGVWGVGCGVVGGRRRSSDLYLEFRVLDKENFLVVRVRRILGVLRLRIVVRRLGV